MPYGVVGGPYGQGAPDAAGGPVVEPLSDEGDIPPLGNMVPAPAAAAAAAAAADILDMDEAPGADGAKQLTVG